MAKSKFQRNIKVQKGILKSKALDWFQVKVQNDILVMPNQALNLLQDVTISHLI